MADLPIWLAGAILLTVRLILAGLALDRLVRRSSDASDDLTPRNAGRSPGTSAATALSGSSARRTSRPPAWPGCCVPCCSSRARVPADRTTCAPSWPTSWRTPGITTWPGTSRPTSHRSLLWFHPLAWRIAAAHAAACDAVSDAVAADYLGDVASLRPDPGAAGGATRHPRAPAHVLAMARTSDVRRRLDALNRQGLPDARSLEASSTAFMIGERPAGAHRRLRLHARRAVRFESRRAQAAKPADPKSPGKLTLRAVAAETERPIEGVSIEYRGRFDGNGPRRTPSRPARTGWRRSTIRPGSRIEYFEITARKAEFVPI